MVDSAKKTSSKQLLTLLMMIVAFVGILVVGMWVSDPNKGKLSAIELSRLEAAEVETNYVKKKGSVVSDEESWISQSEKELTQYQLENKALKQSLSRLEEKLSSLEKKVNDKPSNSRSASSDRLPPAPNMLQATPVNKKSLPPVPNPEELKMVPMGFPGQGDKGDDDNDLKNKIAGNVVPPKGAGGVSRKNESEIMVWDFNPKKKGSEKNQAVKNVSHYIPSGSFGRVVLISGVDAPTGGEAKSNPVPVLMRMIDHGTLPNYFSSEIKDCHVTGAARGDLSSERVKIRTERLSCVLINGDVIEVKVQGWINGEDGSEGFRGRVVEKTGSLLAKSFVSGVFSGLSKNIGSQYQKISQSPLGTISSIDPNDAGKAGFASGLETSTEKLADYYMERANEMYPIIEASANRIGELVLQVGVDLERNIVGNMGGKS